MNPDFGQVESDPSVMNITAFETFYEEKRPFFLEGLTIFDYDFDEQSLFYSRRIGHAPSRTVYPNDSTFVKMPDKTTILSALKFSGTNSKGLSLGLIQSVTGNEFARLSDPDGNRSSQKVEPLTSYTVARIQKGYKEGNTVLGGMLTSTNRSIDDENLEFLTSNAFTGGLDLRHHLRDKEFYIDARLIGSYVNGSTEAITSLQESSARYYQRPDADYLDHDTTSTGLSGFGGRFMIGKGSKGFWRYSTGATWLSPGLELNDLGYMRFADEINQENNLSYFVNQPVSIFRQLNIGLEQFNTWNFDGTYLGSGGRLVFTSEFLNQWSFRTNFSLNSGSLDTRILRGGYDMKMPYSIYSFTNLSTDRSKKVVAGLVYSYEYSGNHSESRYQIAPAISIRPINTLKFELSANYVDNYNELQYVTTKHLATDNRYILGTIDQQTLGLTFRVDLNITPELSIQYYGSPFVSKGSYSEFKHVTSPRAEEYADRFAIYNDPVLSNGTYLLDENDDLVTDYSIGNPDFNFHEFRSNLVAKWEYRLGSYIYLVWSSERTGFADLPEASTGESFRQLRKVFPNNIFLIKLNYWFTL